VLGLPTFSTIGAPAFALGVEFAGRRGFDTTWTVMTERHAFGEHQFVLEAR
jgi:hypothetical protein